jgi:hypothetical protein
MMKTLVVTLLVAILALGAVAVAPHKSVFVTYPQNTPEQILDEAKAVIREAVSRKRDH